MIRSIRISLVCVVLLAIHLACAPKWVGPTAPSGYTFSLTGSDTLIWLLLQGSILEASHPRVAALVVTVKDAQGQPVNGVPVTFQVEPGWAQHATVTPPRVVTQDGMAQAVVEVETTGIVHVMAQVESLTETVAITVQPRPETGAANDE